MIAQLSKKVTINPILSPEITINPEDEDKKLQITKVLGNYEEIPALSLEEREEWGEKLEEARQNDRVLAKLNIEIVLTQRNSPNSMYILVDGELILVVEVEEQPDGQ